LLAMTAVALLSTWRLFILAKCNPLLH
jgi:hypothetical protein